MGEEVERELLYIGAGFALKVLIYTAMGTLEEPE